MPTGARPISFTGGTTLRRRWVVSESEKTVNNNDVFGCVPVAAHTMGGGAGARVNKAAHQDTVGPQENLANKPHGLRAGEARMAGTELLQCKAPQLPVNCAELQIHCTTVSPQ